MWLSNWRKISIDDIDRILFGHKLRPHKLWIAIGITTVSLVSMLVIGGLWHWSSRPLAAPSDHLPELLTKISRHILLPEGPDPMVATITDVESLRRDQVFFHSAQNGDQLVVYPSLAMIYRETEDRLINVGAIHLPTTTPAGLATIASFSVEVRNGSRVIGAGKRMADRLATLPGATVTRIADAARRNYAQTVVVSGSSAASQSVLGFLEIPALSDLPAGEPSSSADILIIVGN